MRLIFLVCVLNFVFAPLYAQYGEQDRAMAVRAARLDAMRQLGEAIQGVRINSSTTVRDFVTESDEIQASMITFLQGAQQVGDPRYLPDGVCEVTMNLSMDQLVAWLKQSCQQHPSYKISDPGQFDQMNYYNPGRIFTATGSGAMKQTPQPYYGGDIWSRVTAQGKLMALRAAKVDAYRNIGETIKGVRLTSNTTVKDFVTESDTIVAAFNGFVRGVQFVGEPRYRPEGVVEITAEVNLQVLSGFLKGVYQNYQSGDPRWNTQTFDNMQYPGGVIRATGTGVPPSKYILPESSQPTPYYPDVQTQPQPPKPYVPEWANRTVQVTGNGAPPANMNPGQARLMAKRAAELDAYRLLVEQIMGLQLQSQTTVQDFVTQNDEINTKVNAFLRGANIVDTRYLGDGSVEVDMKLYLGDMWQIIEAYYHKQY